MNLQEILTVWRARWREEAAVFACVLLVVVAATLLAPRSYVATASLLFDLPGADPSANLDHAEKPADSTQLLTTQADVLRSNDVAQQVIASQRLADDPAALGITRDAAENPRALLDAVQRALIVDVKRDSNVLTVSFRSHDPQLSARVANAFAETYVQTVLKLRTDPAKTYSAWFEERTRDVRQNLERAQNALAEYQRAHGFTDNGNFEAEDNRMKELAVQLAQAEGAAADIRARSGQDAAFSSDVQTTQVVQQLRESIAEQEKKVAELTVHYGPRHPQLMAAQSELDSLRSRLAAETQQARRGLDISRQAADRREAELSRLMDEQRARMVSLADARNQMQVLQRDVDSARAAYDAVTQRLASARLESQLPRTDVRQLDHATSPLRPTSPKLGLRVLIGLALAGLAAAGAGVALELYRPLLRSLGGAQHASGARMAALVDLSASKARHLLGAPR